MLKCFFALFTEAKDLVWKHPDPDLLCEHPLINVLENPPPRHKDDDPFYVPLFNFSLITDPTDPLFEDVIKVLALPVIYFIFLWNVLYFILLTR